MNKSKRVEGSKKMNAEIPSNLPNSGSVFTFWEAFDTNSAKNELLLWKSPYFLSILLSEAILELKMTANSTYREAKLRSNGLKQVKMENGKSSIMIILTFVF